MTLGLCHFYGIFSIFIYISTSFSRTTGCFVLFALNAIKTLYSDLSYIVYSHYLAFTLFSGSYLTSLQGIIHTLSLSSYTGIRLQAVHALQDFGVLQIKKKEINAFTDF